MRRRGSRPGKSRFTMPDGGTGQKFENPVTVTDLHATIFTALGIPPQYSVEIERRPFYVTKDGHGVAVDEVFA